MRFAKPIDTELIDEICLTYDHVITIEDGSIMGGFGSAVSEYIAQKTNHPTVKIMGVPDRIIEHGTQEELHREVGIDTAGIIEKIKSEFKVNV